MNTLVLLSLLVVLFGAVFAKENAVLDADYFDEVYLSIADSYVRVEWVYESEDNRASYYVIDVLSRTSGLTVQTFEKNLGVEFPWDDVQVIGLVTGDRYSIRVTAYSIDNQALASLTEEVTTRQILCDRQETYAGFFAMEVYGPAAWPTYKFCGRTFTTYYTESAENRDDTFRELVVYDQIAGLAIVAYRGTIRSFADWLINFDLDLEPCNKYMDSKCVGEIHSGFGGEYVKSRNALRLRISDFVDAGFKNILITGHSQGAGLATVAAADMFLYINNNAVEFHMINFGSPKVGNNAFIDQFNTNYKAGASAPTMSVRVVSKSTTDGADFDQDPITKIPPELSHVNTLATITIPDSFCDVNSNLFIPCHSIMEYFRAVSGGQANIISPWTKLSTPVFGSLPNAQVPPNTIDHHRNSAGHLAPALALLLVALLCTML